MIGYVINDKHAKTIRVACDRYMYVMRYKKSFRYLKKVWAHDEQSACRVGDIVQIQPLGYRIGPWKTYNLKKIIFRDASALKSQGTLPQLIGSSFSNLKPQGATTTAASSLIFRNSGVTSNYYYDPEDNQNTNIEDLDHFQKLIITASSESNH